MLQVLIQLSAGYLAALIGSLRTSLWFSSHAMRQGHPWLALIMIVLLTDQIEPMEGYNDPNDPLAVAPRIIKWAWFAGLAASVPGRARHLAIPCLLTLHVLAVGYLWDAPERLLYLDHAGRALWMADRVTFLEAVVRQAWVGLGMTGAAWPSAVATGLLLPLLEWSLPAVLLLLLGWCHALHTSAALNVGPATPPAPLRIQPLPGPWLVATAVLWTAGQALDGPAALIALDLAGCAVLWHLVGTLRWLAGSSHLRRWVVPVAVALPILPAVVGPLLGFLGGAVSLWGIRLPVGRPALVLRHLTSWSVVISAVATWAILQEVDVEVANPVDDRATANHIDGHLSGSTPDWQKARAQCARQRARICTLAEWASRPNLRPAPHWEWVALPSGPDTVPGLATTRQVDELVLTTSAAASLAPELRIETAKIRCCQ